MTPHYRFRVGQLSVQYGVPNHTINNVVRCLGIMPERSTGGLREFTIEQADAIGAEIARRLATRAERFGSAAKAVANDA